MTTPLEDLLLQMKSIGISDLSSFPFPTPPPPQSFAAAVTSLTNIGAIHRVHRRKPKAAHMQWLMKDKGAAPSEEAITRLGRVLAKLSISPRLGKLLVLAHRSGHGSLLQHVMSLAAGACVSLLPTSLSLPLFFPHSLTLTSTHRHQLWPKTAPSCKEPAPPTKVLPAPSTALKI